MKKIKMRREMVTDWWAELKNNVQIVLEMECKIDINIKTLAGQGDHGVKCPAL
jgi:hypothetical protein